MIHQAKLKSCARDQAVLVPKCRGLYNNVQSVSASKSKRSSNDCVPFFRIASGNLAFGAPTMLGATEVAGVLMGVELLDGGPAALKLVGVDDFLSPMHIEAAAFARSACASSSCALAFLRKSMLEVQIYGEASRRIKSRKSDKMKALIPSVFRSGAS